MADHINTGGPAFPVAETRDQFGNGLQEGSRGMTLRDYFAAHAPISFDMACASWGDTNPPMDDKGRASFAAVWAFLRYEYADAMLAERSRSEAA